MEILFFILLVFVCWEIYLYIYFKSDKFTSIKNRVSTYVKDCNDLNNHIESLKNTYLGINQLDYGTAEYKDKSTWNYKRPELKKQKYEPNIYNDMRVKTL